MYPALHWQGDSFQILNDYLLRTTNEAWWFLEKSAQFLYDMTGGEPRTSKHHIGSSLSAAIDLHPPWVNPAAPRNRDGIISGDNIAKGGIRSFSVMLVIPPNDHLGTLIFYETTTPEYPVEDLRCIAWCNISISYLKVKKRASDQGNCIDCKAWLDLDDSQRCEDCNMHWLRSIPGRNQPDTTQ